MAERRYFCFCDDNCRFETMTREQIITAITQAVNEGTIGDIDTGFVTTIKTINEKALKFFIGKQSEYEALTDEEKDGLFAIITNDTSKEAFENALAELQTNYEALTTGLASGSIVVGRATNAAKATSATNATYATSAGSATSATQDGSGNTITETYLEKTEQAVSATTVNAESHTVELTWSGESASGDVEFDANSTYLITIPSGTAGVTVTFVLHTLEDVATTASSTYSNLHHLLFYNPETKKLILRRYYFFADDTHEVGYANISGGTSTVTYAKIANLTEGAQ